MTTATDILAYLQRQHTLHHRASTIDMACDLWPQAAEALSQCAGLLGELQRSGWAGSQHVGGLPRWHITPAGAVELEQRQQQRRSPYRPPVTVQWPALHSWHTAAPAAAAPPPPAAAKLQRDEERDPPAIGTLWPAQGGIYAGTARRRTLERCDHHLVLMPAASPAALTWEQAQAWARSRSYYAHRDWDLPTPMEAALLHLNTLPELGELAGAWIWTAHSSDDTAAAAQPLNSPAAITLPRKTPGWAVAVRRVPVQPLPEPEAAEHPHRAGSATSASVRPHVPHPTPEHRGPGWPGLYAGNKPVPSGHPGPPPRTATPAPAYYTGADLRLEDDPEAAELHAAQPAASTANTSA